MKRFFMMGTAISLTALSALTSACGGGDKGVVDPDTTDTTTTPPPPPPPAAITLATAGNIAACNGNEVATAGLISGMGATTQVIALGDNDRKPGTGGVQNYDNCYATSWGVFKDRTRAAVGNHEYDATNAAPGHAAYWGANQGEPGKFWQAYDVGAWRVIILNITDISTAANASYGAGSEQMLWLTSELASNTKKCTLVVMHNAPFLSSQTAGFNTRNNVLQVFARLYNADVDVVLAGNEHRYERFAPMDGAGNVDNTRGITLFNVGTGGESIDRTPTAFRHVNSAAQILDYGVLKMTLKADGYDFQFMNAVNASSTDSGTGTCH